MRSLKCRSTQNDAYHINIAYCNVFTSHEPIQARLRIRPLLLLLLLQLALQNLLPRQHPPAVLLPEGVAVRVYRQKFGAGPLRVRHFFCAMSKPLCDLQSRRGNGGGCCCCCYCHKQRKRGKLIVEVFGIGHTKAAG